MRKLTFNTQRTNNQGVTVTTHQLVVIVSLQPEEIRKHKDCLPHFLHVTEPPSVEAVSVQNNWWLRLFYVDLRLGLTSEFWCPHDPPVEVSPQPVSVPPLTAWPGHSRRTAPVLPGRGSQPSWSCRTAWRGAGPGRCRSRTLQWESRPPE